LDEGLHKHLVCKASQVVVQFGTLAVKLGHAVVALSHRTNHAPGHEGLSTGPAYTRALGDDGGFVGHNDGVESTSIGVDKLVVNGLK
jgi:hypothetical protein